MNRITPGTFIDANANTGDVNVSLDVANFLSFLNAIVFDTNAQTACSGTEYLAGDGSCQTISASGGGGFYFAGGNLTLGDGNIFHVNDSNLFNVLDFTKSTIFNSAFDADFNVNNITRLLQDSNCDNNSNCTISYSVLSNTPHIPSEAEIDANALGIVNDLDLNNSLDYLKNGDITDTTLDDNSTARESFLAENWFWNSTQSFDVVDANTILGDVSGATGLPTDTNAFTGCSVTQVLVGATGCTNTPTLTGTNFTGVPASGITAGTFGSGAYTFPSTLQVNDAISIDGSPQLLLDISGTSTTELNVADSISGVTSRLGVTNTVGFLGTSSDNNFNILTDNTDRIKISNDGWIGFGTNPQPGVMLSIVDTATSSANLISLYSPNQWPGYIVGGGTAGTGVDGVRLQNDDDLSTNFGMTGSSHSSCASCGFIYNSEDGQFSVLFDNSTNSSDVIFPNGSLDIADEITVNSDLGNVDSNFGSDTKQNAFSIDADRDTNGVVSTNVPLHANNGFGLAPVASSSSCLRTLSGDDLTIANDCDLVTVSAQTGTTDNLDTIIGGYDGQVIFMRATFGHDITVRNQQAGSGNQIFTYCDTDYQIDVSEMGFLRRVAGTWYLISPTRVAAFGC